MRFQPQREHVINNEVVKSPGPRFLDLSVIGSYGRKPKEIPRRRRDEMTPAGRHAQPSVLSASSHPSPSPKANSFHLGPKKLSSSTPERRPFHLLGSSVPTSFPSR